jgi:hypothetical protein
MLSQRRSIDFFCRCRQKQAANQWLQETNCVPGKTESSLMYRVRIESRDVANSSHEFEKALRNSLTRAGGDHNKIEFNQGRRIREETLSFFLQD